MGDNHIIHTNYYLNVIFPRWSLRCIQEMAALSCSPSSARLDAFVLILNSAHPGRRTEDDGGRGRGQRQPTKSQSADQRRNTQLMKCGIVAATVSEWLLPYPWSASGYAASSHILIFNSCAFRNLLWPSILPALDGSSCTLARQARTHTGNTSFPKHNTR